MDFNEKDIKNYIKKRNELEKNLYAERAYGKASKTTLRKIEELNRIIHYEDYLSYAKDLKRKVDYYESLLDKHKISYLK